MIGGCLYPETWLHHVPARAKLALLLITTTVFLLLHKPIIILLALATTLAVYVSLGNSAIRRLRLFTPILPFLVFLYCLQWFLSGHSVALTSVARLCFLVLLADLVTMTTTMQAMLDAVMPLFRPLDRWGPYSARIALAVALVVRFVPVMFELWMRRRDAWHARTRQRTGLAMMRPFLSDVLRVSDHVAEALDSRGYNRRSLDRQLSDK